MNNTSINTDRLIHRFCRLVSLDSPSFGERAVADYLIAEYKKLHITLTEDDTAARIGGNTGALHGLVPGEPGLSPLLFCAHMDTVEPSRGKKAVVHPDGKITSDGTTVLGADDAAALAVFLEAVQTLQESRCPHPPVELLFTPAEEPYCAGAAALDYTVLQSREAYVFDLSGPVGGAAVQAPTILSFSVTFTGRAAHAGFAPQEGIHAIQAAALAISRLENGRVGDVTVNIGTIRGGIQNNVVPPEAVFTGEIRSYSDAHAMAQYEHIRLVSEQAAQSMGACAHAAYTRHITAYQTPEDHPVVVRYQKACRALGLPCTLMPTFGGSDNNHLAVHGIRGIVPATAMNQVHTCGEYTTVSQLQAAAQLALLLMKGGEET